MVLKEKYILYIYVFLWILYELQGLLWTEGNALSIIAIVILNVISVIYVVKVNLDFGEKPIYLVALNALVLLFTFYGIVYALEGEHYYPELTDNKSFNYLKNIYNSLLPIYLFSYFSWKGILTQRMMRFLGGGFFFMAVMSYWNFEMDARAKMLENGIDKESLVNNMGYGILCLFPVLTFYYKRPWVQYLGLICVMTFVLMGMKRGAILIGVCCMVGFLMEMFKYAKRFKKVVIVLTSLGVVVALAFFTVFLLETNETYSQRIQSTMEGYVSGRDVLYRTLYSYFIYDTDSFQFLFGSGANATLGIAGKLAHNDWLELAVNQGMLGLGIYLFYWISFFLLLRKMKGDSLLHTAFGLLFFIFFMRTFFSMSYDDMNIYSTSVLGFCLGCVVRKQKC